MTGYGLGLRSRFGRERLSGALAAYRRLPALFAAPPERLVAVYAATSRGSPLASAPDAVLKPDDRLPAGAGNQVLGLEGLADLEEDRVARRRSAAIPRGCR